MGISNLTLKWGICTSRGCIRCFHPFSCRLVVYHENPSSNTECWISEYLTHTSFQSEGSISDRFPTGRSCIKPSENPLYGLIFCSFAMWPSATDASKTDLTSAKKAWSALDLLIPDPAVEATSRLKKWGPCVFSGRVHWFFHWNPWDTYMCFFLGLL